MIIDVLPYLLLKAADYREQAPSKHCSNHDTMSEFTKLPAPLSMVPQDEILVDSILQLLILVMRKLSPIA